MLRKTMKMLVLALVAAFALSSMAEAAAPKKTVRHRTKHSSRVASGASITAVKTPAPTKKKTTAASRSRTRSQARRSTTSTAKKPAAKRAPATRRPTTKPR